MPRWTADEHNTLLSLLEDGVSIQTLCDSIPGHSDGGIVTRARNKKLGLDFRTSRVDGKLYKGVNRRTKVEIIDEALSEKVTIIDEATATNSSTPTTSERTKQNASDDIVAKKDTGVAKTELSSIYDDVTSLFSNSNYSLLQSITVAFSNVTMTITKDSL